MPNVRGIQLPQTFGKMTESPSVQYVSSPFLTTLHRKTFGSSTKLMLFDTNTQKFSDLQESTACFTAIVSLSVALSGPGSSVGTATGYGLDGPGSNPGVGEIFRTSPYRPWGPPSLLYSGYRVFPGVKSGRGVTLTPHPLLVPLS